MGAKASGLQYSVTPRGNAIRLVSQCITSIGEQRRRSSPLAFRPCRCGRRRGSPYHTSQRNISERGAPQQCCCGGHASSGRGACSARGDTRGDTSTCPCAARAARGRKWLLRQLFFSDHATLTDPSIGAEIDVRGSSGCAPRPLTSVATETTEERRALSVRLRNVEGFDL